MNDLPSPDQLLSAVRAFLRDELAPALAAPAEGDTVQAALAYQVKVAAHVLGIVQRQLAQAPVGAAAEMAKSPEAAECNRLQALLASTETALPALTRQLAERITAGAIDAATPGLAEHLWLTTLAKLAVDQPGYDTYRRHAGPPPET